MFDHIAATFSETTSPTKAESSRTQNTSGHEQPKASSLHSFIDELMEAHRYVHNRRTAAGQN